MVLSDKLVDLKKNIVHGFCVLLERVMAVWSHFWDSLKIENQFWTRIVVWCENWDASFWYEKWFSELTSKN